MAPTTADDDILRGYRFVRPPVAVRETPARPGHVAGYGVWIRLNKALALDEDGVIAHLDLEGVITDDAGDPFGARRRHCYEFSVNDEQGQLAAIKPGEKVTVTLSRRASEIPAEVRLRSRRRAADRIARLGCGRPAR